MTGLVAPFWPQPVFQYIYLAPQLPSAPLLSPVILWHLLFCAGQVKQSGAVSLKPAARVIWKQG